MNKGIKTISAVLVLSLAIGSLSGCDMIFGAKKREAQEETVTEYIQACLEFRYDDAMQYVDGKGKGDAFQDVDIEDPRQELVEICLAQAEVEVVKVEDDKVTVNLSVPDVDKTIRKGDPETYSIDELTEMIENSDNIDETKFVFKMVKADSSWVIERKSTEDLAEYIDSIAVQTAPLLNIATNAYDIVDGYMHLMQQGDVDAAMNLTTSMSMVGYSIFDYSNYGDMYSQIYSRIEYELDVDSVSSDGATVVISGRRPDLQSGMDIASQDHDIMLNYAKNYIMLLADTGVLQLYVMNDYNDYDDFDYEAYISGLIDVYADLIADAVEVSPTVDFTFDAEVVLNDAGNLKIDEEITTSVCGDMGEPELPDEIIDEALNELLADGSITQEMYDAMAGLGPDAFVV